MDLVVRVHSGYLSELEADSARLDKLERVADQICFANKVILCRGVGWRRGTLRAAIDAVEETK